MNGMTENALDGCEEYVIVTERGTRLTNVAVGVSKKVRMECFGKSVYVDEAVRELVAFKNDTLHLRA